MAQANFPEYPDTSELTELGQSQLTKLWCIDGEKNSAKDNGVSGVKPLTMFNFYPALALILAGLFALESESSPRKFTTPDQKTIIYVASENENKDTKESDGIGGVISYHYKAALRGEKPIIRCPPEYEKFKPCLIDGAYCLAEKKFDFAIRNFEEALI